MLAPRSPPLLTVLSQGVLETLQARLAICADPLVRAADPGLCPPGALLRSLPGSPSPGH